jgi:ribosomal protein S18 acetylase RimI-like enzyme
MIALSSIDQERFGIVTARDGEVTLSTLEPDLAFCRARGVQLLIARCRTEELEVAQALEAAGGQLMDTLVYYGSRLDCPGPDDQKVVQVRRLQADDAPAVSRVAAQAFGGYFGHYHADPRLDRAKADEAYASWAARSCSDPSAADTVLVAERAGHVVGFLTLQRRGRNEQEVILNAVEPAAQRHGIYKALMVEAMRSARADGAALLSISTQITNLAVQKVWSRLGFEPSRSYYTFHLWLDQA